MATITRIEIDGFKAFPKNFVLDLEEGKNLLLYGENGSGKSSIYYALHVVFQSILKDDKGAKYFTPGNSVQGEFIIEDENLININRFDEAKANTFQPYIKVTFNDGKIWRINRSGLASENGGVKEQIKLLNRGSAFINHSYISRFHAARNSEEIDLWNVFHKDILPFYRAKENEEFLSVLFDNIKSDADNNPRMNNKSFLKRIDDFNDKLSHFIEDANKRIEKIYNENFKFNEDPKLDIKLMYLADNADENPSHFPYYLFYGKIRNGQQRPKSLHIPKIGIIIKENGKEIQKPQTHFNEARLTAIALAVRFACLSKKSDGCFLALDDMLISLDMSNRMQVIRYLLNVAIKTHKLYIFTHDRLFFHTFKRTIETQYDPNNWRFGGLYSNDLGDFLTPEYKMFSKETVIDIKDAYQRHDYFLCGILLRKKLEQILKEILPESFLTKQDPQTQLSSIKNLDEQIISLKDFCEKEGIDYSPFKNLKIYKDLFLNSTAHNDITSPFYKNEIKLCLKAIEELSKVNRAKELKCERDIKFTTNDINGDTYLIGIRCREPIRLLEYNGEIRISYFSKCTLMRIIHSEEREDINMGFESLYGVYNYICNRIGIPPTEDLLDILQDRVGYIKDKIV